LSYSTASGSERDKDSTLERRIIYRTVAKVAPLTRSLPFAVLYLSPAKAGFGFLIDRFPSAKALGYVKSPLRGWKAIAIKARGCLYPER